MTKATPVNLQIMSILTGINWVTDYRFDVAEPDRKRRQWEMDIAAPVQRIAIEIEGGVWIRGRHTRGKGYIGDMEKYNRAVVLGWRLLRYTPDQFKRGDYVPDVRRLLE
jgi:hypothetical protein